MFRDENYGRTRLANERSDDFYRVLKPLFEHSCGCGLSPEEVFYLIVENADLLVLQYCRHERERRTAGDTTKDTFDKENANDPSTM